MSAHVDIAGIVAEAKHPELIELERQFQEAKAKLDAANRELSDLRDRLQFVSFANPMPDEQRRGAQRRVEELNGIIDALHKTAQDIHRRAAEARPASLAAVAAALEPLRRQNAADIAAARGALYAAVGRYNEIMSSLAREGSSDKEVPPSIPVLDAIVAGAERLR
ncbi:hypothetical protein [Bradyrhizobium sp. LA6.12]|uniref:hypothetical protein n=1 Tax=unclassified Bradyrhizobium TaxID=2631580 RepID=UPI003399E04B